jgi:hypothetical protein
MELCRNPNAFSTRPSALIFAPHPCKAATSGRAVAKRFGPQKIAQVSQLYAGLIFFGWRRGLSGRTTHHLGNMSETLNGPHSTPLKIPA